MIQVIEDEFFGPDLNVEDSSEKFDATPSNHNNDIASYLQEFINTTSSKTISAAVQAVEIMLMVLKHICYYS